MGYNGIEVAKLDKKEKKDRAITRLAELRGDRTQEYIAKHTGLTQQSYRNYESGERQANYATLIRLADYFGVTIDYLLGRNTPQSLSPVKQEIVNKLPDLSEEQADIVLGLINHIK